MNCESGRTTIGVPKESAPGERRVALVPDVVRRLGNVVEVVVEPGAGAGALIPDELYESAGARLGDAWECDAPHEVRSERAGLTPRVATFGAVSSAGENASRDPAHAPALRGMKLPGEGAGVIRWPT